MDQIASYDSSDSSDDEREALTPLKLPKPSMALLPNQPTANPLLHQGRKRSTPHVEGQFTSFVYVSVHVDTRFQQFLEEVTQFSKERVATLQSDWLGLGVPSSSSMSTSDRELHVSLTRPIYLFHHQREEFKSAVKLLANSSSRFSASFATFASFVNDEKSRAFVGLEIGAGHETLKDISESLDQALHFFRQNAYYPEPRFHSSFGWALLDTDDERSEEVSKSYPTVPELPSTLISELVTKYGIRLAGKLGTFEVDCLKAKIGKEVYSYQVA